MIDKFEKLQIIDNMLLILQNEFVGGSVSESKDIIKFIQRIRDIIDEFQ